MTWISFGFGFAVVDSLFPSASKHSWNDWDKIKKILPPSSQNCVEDLWIKGGFQNIIAEGFQHIVKGQHVLRSHQVVHFSLCCWWGLQSVTFIHLIHQNTNAQRRRNTETRQGRWASANCRLVRAAGWLSNSVAHSLVCAHDNRFHRCFVLVEFQYTMDRPKQPASQISKVILLLRVGVGGRDEHEDFRSKGSQRSGLFWWVALKAGWHSCLPTPKNTIRVGGSTG